MNIAIYTDYFNGMPDYGGGGETYAIYMSYVLSKKFDVAVFTNKVNDKHVNILDVYKFYKIPDDVISQIEFVYAPSIGWEAGRFEREEALRQIFESKINNKYDVFINASDNTLQGFANTNSNTKCIKISHFPWSNVDAGASALLNFKRKIDFADSYDLFLCNSNFTCKWQEKIHGVQPKILYPPINQQALNKKDLSKKENIVLCAGRIVDKKNTLLLAKSFVRFWDNHKDYKLIIAGNFDRDHKPYLNKIIDVLDNCDHEIRLDVVQDEFNEIYKRSKIFWSACGYQESNPMDVEHFGMTTVEAMANGCVPIVVNNGGSPEIITDECGFCYNDVNDLIAYTSKIVEADDLYTRLATGSIERSKNFDLISFEDNLARYINF